MIFRRKWDKRVECYPNLPLRTAEHLQAPEKPTPRNDKIFIYFYLSTIGYFVWGIFFR